MTDPQEQAEDARAALREMRADSGRFSADEIAAFDLLLEDHKRKAATLAKVRELATEHWDWKAGRTLAERLRAILATSAEAERLIDPPTDEEREALTLIARDVHLYDGGPTCALLGRDARRIADAILASDVWRNRRRGLVTDDEVETAWSVVAMATGYFGKPVMRAALEAALGVDSVRALARVKAETLRQTADRLRTEGIPMLRFHREQAVSDWLRDEADLIESEVTE